MKARHLLLGVTCASLLGAAVLAGTAQAQDTIYVPLLTYRTGRSPARAFRSPTACTTI